MSGFRIVVEGPMGSLWSQERSPDEANFLRRGGFLESFTSWTLFKFYLKCILCQVEGAVESPKSEVPALLMSVVASCPLIELHQFEVIFCFLSLMSMKSTHSDAHLKVSIINPSLVIIKLTIILACP